MSKAGAIAALSVGGSGAALTTAYLSGAFGGNYDVELPKSLTDFKNATEVEGCVLNLFPGIANMKDTGLNDPAAKNEANFFQGEGEISSCLVINWEKYKPQTGSENKWRGDFRFLWAAKKGNKGFVTFAKATTPANGSTDKKITWEGTIYEVGSDTGKNNWKQKNKKDITTPKDQTNGDLSSKFPQIKEELLKENQEQTSLSFLPSSNPPGELCDSSACTQLSESFKGYWEWTNSDKENTTLGDWTTNLSTWWNDLFGTDKWDMSKIVENNKGTWNQRKIVKPNKPTTEATQS